MKPIIFLVCLFKSFRLQIYKATAAIFWQCASYALLLSQLDHLFHWRHFHSESSVKRLLESTELAIVTQGAQRGGCEHRTCSGFRPFLRFHRMKAFAATTSHSHILLPDDIFCPCDLLKTGIISIS